jgi:hypothetical protein
MTFEEARAHCIADLMSSGQESDWQCHLCEDGRHAMLFANYYSDEPVMYVFNLPATIDEDVFDPQLYLSQCPTVAR